MKRAIILVKRSKRTNKKHTTVIVPETKNITERTSISKVAMKYAAGGLCLLMLCGVGGVVHYRQVVSTANLEKAELEFLRKNNQSQLEEIEELSKVTVSLETDMERLNALDAEIRSIVKNEDQTATSRAGLIRPAIPGNRENGAQGDIEDINRRVNQLKFSMNLREESLTQLKDELLAKQARLAATPSIWPAAGTVTSRFGRRGGEYHPGIDIAGASGTPVVATADGIVVHSDWDDGGYGKLVQIAHGNGIETLYGHNSASVVSNGQTVKRGQLIAYSGSTGSSTGPHVHYEIRVNGTAVNPANFLK